MNHHNNNALIWDKLYKNGAQMSHPDDSFIRMSHYLLKDNTSKILDYGFGSGVTTIHLAHRGFEVTGIEISQEAINTTQTRLDNLQLTAQLDHYDGSQHLPYQDNSFDAVIAWQALTYNTPDSFQQIMQEFYRILKPDGVFLAATSAPEDHIYKNSTLLDNGARRLTTIGQEGATVFIPTRQELKDLSPALDIKIGEITLDYQEINNIFCRYHLIHYIK
jgi:ubiquinone/menaquinone biosynthesis C-methylase UbiE